MLKAPVRILFESLGYSVRRITPPAPPASTPVRSPALRPVRVALFPNLAVEVDLSDDMPRQAIRQGDDYEAPCPKLLRAFCSAPGDVFFDVGANFGFYSYYMLVHAPQAVVHSFEPNPMHVRRQQATAAEYAAARYFPHQLGLGDQAGELSLTVSSIDTGWSTFGKNPHFAGLEASLSTHRVPVTTFDAWRATCGLPLPASPSWVMKMDIEGFETRALRGMQESLRAQAFKALLIEVLDHTLNFCGTSAGELFALMNDAGYAPFDVWLQPTALQAQEARNILFLPKAQNPAGNAQQR